MRKKVKMMIIEINENNEVGIEVTQRAIIVGLNERGDISESMEELWELAEAAGAIVVSEMIQNKQKIDPAFFIGKGKVQELKEACFNLDANIVIFNDELSGVQLRNLEDELDIKVIDRTVLILDIFAKRAVSKEGKLQVELAQLKYRKARIKGMGKSLSRAGGGIGTKGPGEKKLETDRRYLERRVLEIEKELFEIKKNRGTQRAKRVKSSLPVVALVGYTNSGKSTIMNSILNKIDRSEKSVFAKDMLFATLDTFQRNIKLDTNDEFILIDTVGFVSKLPHSLINAFKATLEEVLYADLLIHVVDASNEKLDFQMAVTDRVLTEIGANEKQKIVAFNKIDKIKYDKSDIPSGEDYIYISAITEKGVNEIIENIKKIIFSDLKKVELIIPYDKGEITSYLCENTKVDLMEYIELGVRLISNLSNADYNKYSSYIVSKEGGDEIE